MHTCVLAGLAAALGSALASASVPIRTVVLTNDPAPGLEPGVVFDTLLSDPVINNQGTIGFGALLDGGDVTSTNDSSTWIEGTSLTLLLREGQPAPGFQAGEELSILGTPLLNDVGLTGIIGFWRVIEFSSNERALWKQTGPDIFTLVASEGMQVPGQPEGVTFANGWGGWALNNAGHVAFTNAIDIPNEPGNKFGIWRDTGQGLDSVAITDQPAPGIDGSYAFSQFFRPPTLNAHGDVAFWSRLSAPLESDETIWFTSDSGGLTLIAREGDPVPGLAEGVTFRDLDDFPFPNVQGTVLFSAALQGPGINNTNDFALWTNTAGIFTLIAREGDPAPDTEPGTVWGTSFGIQTDAGSIILRANLAGPSVTDSNDVGIWRISDGTPELIWRAGMPAPGFIQPTTFADSLSGFLANDFAQVALLTDVVSQDLEGPSGRGLWAFTPTDELRLIAQTGQPFDVDDHPAMSDLRTVQSISFLTAGSASEDGRQTSFNALGQLVFNLSFTDGSSGIFVAYVGEDCPGDLNTTGTTNGFPDGETNLADLQHFLTVWQTDLGLTPGSAADVNTTGTTNGEPDGEVNLADLQFFLTQWQAGLSECP